MMRRTGLLLLLSAVCAAGGDETVYRAPADQRAPVDSSQQIAQRIVTAPLPVLVDFWASWCAPCRMLDPILEELEKEYHGRVIFMKVNVDAHRGIAGYFGVQGIPAVFFVKEKTVVDMLQGFHPKARYAEKLDSLIAMRVIPQSSPAAPPAKKPSRATY